MGSDEVNRVQYTAHGAISRMRLGNGLWEHSHFNTRLQVTQIGLGTAATNSSVLQLDYGYGATANNGNLLSQSITIPGLMLNQSYTYDALNRLQTASENGGTSWKQKFVYDRYGNRRIIGTEGDGVAAISQWDVDEQGNRLASGSIVVNSLRTSPFYFSGLGSARDWGIRGKKLTQHELRQLVLIHELVHLADAAGKYDDAIVIIRGKPQPNTKLNRLISKKCF